MSTCGGKAGPSVQGSPSTVSPTPIAEAGSPGMVDGSFVDSPLSACESGGCQVRQCVPIKAMGVYNPPPGATPLNADWTFECQVVFGWGWDGLECSPIVGCECQGVDCSDLLPRKSACQAAYAHCSGDSGP